MKDEVVFRFDDYNFLQELLGYQNSHLKYLEKEFDVVFHTRGNRIFVSGHKEKISFIENLFKELSSKVHHRQKIDIEDIETAIRFIKPTLNNKDKKMEKITENNSQTIKTKNGIIAPKSPGQIDYMNELGTKDLVFGIGPAGTGKTYLAVAQAVKMLLTSQVDRIILSRPAVEAGEKLGFLPGDLKEKIDPYLRPLFDSIHDMMPEEQIKRKIENSEIEIAPLAFMRGRTLNNAFVILDEAQNTTVAQMKMFLTRMGRSTRMVVTGDITQIDLPKGVKSGLPDAIDKLQNIDDISVCRLTSSDVIRHPLVAKIVNAYEKGSE